jgi:hypothetical protein
MLNLAVRKVKRLPCRNYTQFSTSRQPVLGIEPSTGCLNICGYHVVGTVHFCRYWPLVRFPATVGSKMCHNSRKSSMPGLDFSLPYNDSFMHRPYLANIVCQYLPASLSHGTWIIGWSVYDCPIAWAIMRTDSLYKEPYLAHLSNTLIAGTRLKARSESLVKQQWLLIGGLKKTNALLFPPHAQSRTVSQLCSVLHRPETNKWPIPRANPQFLAGADCPRGKGHLCLVLKLMLWKSCRKYNITLFATAFMYIQIQLHVPWLNHSVLSSCFFRFY